MPVRVSLLLLIAALVCFVIALLLVLDVFSGSNHVAWLYGGFVAWVASILAGEADRPKG